MFISAIYLVNPPPPIGYIMCQSYDSLIHVSPTSTNVWTSVLKILQPVSSTEELWELKSLDLKLLMWRNIGTVEG